MPRPARRARRIDAFLLKRLGLAAKERAIDGVRGDAGCTRTTTRSSLVLDEGSRETQGSIADALGYDRGQLVGLLDELEERGLIERRRDPGRPPAAPRPAHAGREADAEAAPRARQRDRGRVPRAARDEERAELHALLLRLAEKHQPRCALSIQGNDVRQSSGMAGPKELPGKGAAG